MINKKTQFQSSFGGIFSILVKVSIFIYSVLILRQTIKKEVFSIQSQIENTDLFFEEDLKLELNRENFDFAFLISGANQTILDNI